MKFRQENYTLPREALTHLLGCVERYSKECLEITTGQRPTHSENLHEKRRHGNADPDTEDLADLEKEKTQKISRSFRFSSKLDKNPEKSLNNNRKRCHLEQEELKTKDVASKESPHVLFYKMKQFRHFQYVYNQTADCESRVQKLQNDIVSTNQMAKDILIKIRILGDFSDEDLNLISKSEGRTKISNSQPIWEANPVVCFQNHHYSRSKLKEYDFHEKSACHKILIKSDTFYDDTDENDDTIISVPRNRTQIQEAITFCLEEPIDKMLKQWLKDLKSTDSSKFTSRVIAEIEAIRKQMTLENNRDATACSALLTVETTSVIPEEIKDYLFGRPDVNSFGIWRNSSFKILVEETDENMLRCDLTKKNPKFFETYKLEVEKRKLVDRLSNMIQGDSIMAKIQNEDGNYRKGTLGGFVTKSDEEEKKYALTCNHIFPEVGEPAYNQNLENIGSCLFTTRDQSCDFAAIEIEQSFSDKCDVYVKRDDRKKTNAQVYAGNIENIGLVHKIGATTDITKGNILSPEWHDRVLGENWVSIFLVQGIEGNFSEDGDSGSLVFSRPRSVQQNSVDVMGMVYGNKLTVYEENEHVENNSNEGEIAALNVQDADNISGCFRIHTALELFKESQVEDFEVKFKDDLSSSSPSSSLSDDSIEEPI